MASLELDRKSRRYRVRFRFEGREFKRSLRTTSRRKAEAALVRLEEMIDLVSSGRLKIPDGVGSIRFLMSDGRLSTDPKSEEVASLTQVLSAYQEALPEGAKERTTLYTEAIHLRHLSRLLPADHPFAELDVTLLQAYVRSRLAEDRHGRPISSDTIKKELATLRVVWNWAIDRGLINKPFPSRGLVFPKRSEKPPFRTWPEITRTLARGGLSADEEAELWESLFLTREEIERLLEHVERNAERDFVYPMILIAAHTGARRSEIVRARLDDFDFTTRLVRLREKKRARNRSVTFRYVPMTEHLEAILSDWVKRRRRGQAAFMLESQTPLNVDTARYWFNRTLRGSKWARVRGFHVLRHSFASNLAACGVDQRIIDEWLGHQTEEMRRRYRHLFPDQQRSAIDVAFPGKTGGVGTGREAG